MLKNNQRKQKNTERKPDSRLYLSHEKSLNSGQEKKGRKKRKKKVDITVGHKRDGDFCFGYCLKHLKHGTAVRFVASKTC